MRRAGDVERRAQRRDSASMARRSSRPRQSSVAMRSVFGSTLNVTSVRKPERAAGAGEKLDQIEPGDVLHHPPARFHHLAAAVDGPDADQAVARAAGHDAAGTGNVHRRHRADRRLARACREAADNPSARTAVPGLFRRATRTTSETGVPALGRDDQFGRLVERDARHVRSRTVAHRLHRPAERGLAVGAADREPWPAQPRPPR